MQTPADREDVFHPTAPQCGGTRLRLHKPLLSPALGGSKFGVRDEVTVCRPRLTLRSPSCLAKADRLESEGRFPRPPRSRQWGWVQSVAGSPTSLSRLDRGVMGPGPSHRLQLPALPTPLAPQHALTCPGRGRGLDRDPGWDRSPVVRWSPAQRLLRGAVRRRPVLKAACLRRGPDPGRGRGLRAALAHRQRRPLGWPRCPWRAGGRAGSESL